ncbi:MAG: alpha/beta hydrolase [Candidatus Marinimicrobia bacterium]|nr:alpha/beta hydrolase [Candidatus Neomarinimicrobiota bacterium]
MRQSFVIISFIIFLSCADKESNDAPIPPVGYLNYTLLEWSAGMGLLHLINREPDIPSELEAILDIPFKETPERLLKLDIFRKKDHSGLAPVVIFIHGGSWKYGGKEDYLFYLIEFAKKGYITATLSYRLSQEAFFPSAVEDINCGIRWFKDHGLDYGIDTDKVVLVGGSAGGHLAMMSGYTDQYETCGSIGDIQGIVNIYGPCDLTTDFALSNSALTDFIGHNYDENPNPFKEASPLTHISSDDPPTITFHGTIDKVVPVSQADTLDQRLRRVGVSHEYHRLKGWPHTMDLAVPVNEYMQFYMAKFFEKVVPFNDE